MDALFLDQFPTGSYLPTLTLITPLMRECEDCSLPKPHQKKKKNPADLTLIPGDRVLLKTLHHKDLHPQCTGLFEIVLTTPEIRDQSLSRVRLFATP